MAKRNYDDFISFVKSNQNLTRTEIYWAYRDKGGKIKKQTALDLIRDYTKVDKGTERKSTVKKLVQEKKKSSRLTFGKATTFRSLQSPVIRRLHENIQRLYQHDEDIRKYLKVKVEIRDDEFTTESKEGFSVFVPIQTKSLSVHHVAKLILNNLLTYYQNLSQMYGELTNKIKLINQRLVAVKSAVKTQLDMTKIEMISIYSSNGFVITEFEVFEFKD